MRERKRQKGNKDDDHEVDDHQTVIMMRADGHEERERMKHSDSTIHSHDTHTRTVTTRLTVCVPCAHVAVHGSPAALEAGKRRNSEIFSPGREKRMVILK